MVPVYETYLPTMVARMEAVYEIYPKPMVARIWLYMRPTLQQ
jgi:hypothetical protein